ncbi:MAG: hypothetical protein DI630_35430 [Gordonia sp. (in: high G+C Gram-positive bacteria)]|nr:MAG: hypothetical protein DI630_35430 [Gordonia sp. (in: high G+C Gram-positive bacteria)]
MLTIYRGAPTASTRVAKPTTVRFSIGSQVERPDVERVRIRVSATRVRVAPRAYSRRWTRVRPVVGARDQGSDGLAGTGPRC